MENEQICKARFLSVDASIHEARKHRLEIQYVERCYASGVTHFRAKRALQIASAMTRLIRRTDMAEIEVRFEPKYFLDKHAQRIHILPYLVGMQT